MFHNRNKLSIKSLDKEYVTENTDAFLFRQQLIAQKYVFNLLKNLY